MDELLIRVPDSYRGLLLNDLQGGPASCGCGNLQCRWAIDYGVPATATKEGADDAAARFVSEVRKLTPGKQIVPIWMTECEERDLPAAKAPNGKSTGLCGNVHCATGTCPQAFATQLRALVDAHPQPLGLLTAQQSCGRDAEIYGGPTGWISASVAYLDSISLAPVRRLPHEQLWLVVQGTAKNRETEMAPRKAALSQQPGAVIVARVPLDQSFEPRIMTVE